MLTFSSSSPGGQADAVVRDFKLKGVFVLCQFDFYDCRSCAGEGMFDGIG